MVRAIDMVRVLHGRTAMPNAGVQTRQSASSYPLLLESHTVSGERDAWEKFREIRESVIIAKLFRRDIFLI